MAKVSLLITALLLSYCTAHESSSIKKRSRRRTDKRRHHLKTGQSHDVPSEGALHVSSDPDEMDARKLHKKTEEDATVTSDEIRREMTYNPLTLADDSEEKGGQQNPLKDEAEPQNDALTEQEERELATHPDGIAYRLFRRGPNSLLSILSSKSMRKTCELVTIQFTWSSPSDSQNTAWMLSLGSLGALESNNLPFYDIDYGRPNNGEGLIIEYSNRQYFYQEGERHSFCLPGVGEYTLTVFDWSGGMDGGFKLFSDDGRELVSSDNNEGGGYMTSQSFTLPLPPLATPVPSVSPAPSTSSSPTRDCEWIVIDILYDMYPEETTW
jgi:hypothetical protein